MTVMTDLQVIHVAEAPAAPALFRSPSAPVRRTLVDILDATVRAHPAAAAIETGAGRLTYRELADEVEALRGRLSGQGIGAGDRLCPEKSRGGRFPHRPSISAF